MAPKKRRTGGRTTPPGTQSHQGRSPEATTRYTPPVPVTVKESPKWVPVLMFTLIGLGVVSIMLRYIVPAWNYTNIPVVVGLGFMLGGLFTATK